MSAKPTDALIETLHARFRDNMPRHAGVDWDAVRSRLLKDPRKLKSLMEMERTGGEPDVVCGTGFDGYAYCDCSAESPTGRRSLCYDQEALDARKEHKPKNSALGMAESMGIELLSEEAYAALQQVVSCDAKTSSWIRTPPAIRKLGGALFGDRRYGRIFTYHNGAESYYASRGFRGMLRI